MGVLDTRRTTTDTRRSTTAAHFLSTMSLSMRSFVRYLMAMRSCSSSSRESTPIVSYRCSLVNNRRMLSVNASAALTHPAQQRGGTPTSLLRAAGCLPRRSMRNEANLYRHSNLRHWSCLRTALATSVSKHFRLHLCNYLPCTIWVSPRTRLAITLHQIGPADSCYRHYHDDYQWCHAALLI